MDAPLNLVEILRASDEATRREFLKRVLAAGASGPLLGA